MAVGHLEGKRTGRPRGSKSLSPSLRGLLWADRYFGKDMAPPTPEAKRWIDLAREHPERFVAAIKKLDEYRRGSTGEKRSGVVARAGERRKTIFLPESELLKLCKMPRFNLPSDRKLIDCTFTKARGGVLLTIESATFEPLADGEPVPELRSRFPDHS